MKKIQYLVLRLLVLFLIITFSFITGAVKNDNQNIYCTDQSEIYDKIWSMYGCNAQHTGRSPFDSSKNDGSELWKVETLRSISSTPVIGNDGTIYVGNRMYLSAIDPSNLELKWIYETPDHSYIDESPALGIDNTIYIVDTNGYITAINPEGDEIWRVNIGSYSYIQAPTIGDNGVIYASNLNGDFAAISPNGFIKWKLKFSTVISSPAISNDGTIYLGCDNTKLYAIHPEGEILWEFKADCPLANPSIDYDGMIYAPGCSLGSNQLYAVYPNGTLKWKFIPDLQVQALIPNYPAIDENTIYIATGNGKIYALDKITGEKKWSLELTSYNYGIITAPAIGDDGTIFVNCEKQVSNLQTKGFMYAITPEGEIKWESEMTCNKQYSSCNVLSCPVIGVDGTVYCGSWFLGDHHFYGYIHAFGSSEDNLPPTNPTVKGPSIGRIGTSYDFLLSANDPNGDDVYYFIDWDEEEDAFAEEPYTGWIGPYKSGEKIVVNHTWDWDYIHQFKIRVKARDEHGLEGEWSTFSITMPKSKLNQDIWIFFVDWLYDHLPFFSMILK